MAKIKLSPEELMAQSTEFSSLQSEYEALFAQATTALNGMNESWSPNLSHNFSGKIQSAQKKFSSVTNMLANGAAAARISASVFTTPSNILAQLNGFFDKTSDKLEKWQESIEGNSLRTILTEEEEQQLIDMLPDSLKKNAAKASSIETWLAENYDKIPESDREQLGAMLSPEMKEMIGVTHDVMQGKGAIEAIGKTAEVVTGDPLKGIAVQSTLEAVFNEDLKDDAGLMKVVQGNSARAAEAFKDGEYLDGAVYTSKAFAAQLKNDAGKFGYALGDTVTNMFGYAAGKASSVTRAVSEAAGIIIPGDLGETIQKGVKVVADGLKGAGIWLKGSM